MGAEHGQNVLLYIGDGGAIELTGVDFSVVADTGANKVHRVAGGYVGAGAQVGMVAHIEGFPNNGTFHAIVSAVTNTDLTLSSIVDEDGNAAALDDEAAGATVTVTLEKFIKIKGQRDTRATGAGNSIDTSSKDSGGFGSSIAGTRRQTVACSGVAKWPDLTGIEKLRKHWEDGTRPWCKLVMNEAGAYWYGQYAVTQFDSGGSNESATDYSGTLENSIKPTWVPAA